MYINEKGVSRLIYVWCYLDNMSIKLEKEQEKYIDNKKVYNWLAKELKAVNTMRDEVMRIFEYENYNAFVDLVIKKYATFHNCWHLK